MINQEELAICRQRGHQIDALMFCDGWPQCPACKMWVRQVRTIEEREDAPPKKERSTFSKD